MLLQPAGKSYSVIYAVRAQCCCHLPCAAAFHLCAQLLAGLQQPQQHILVMADRSVAQQRCLQLVTLQQRNVLLSLCSAALPCVATLHVALMRSRRDACRRSHGAEDGFQCDEAGRMHQHVMNVKRPWQSSSCASVDCLSNSNTSSTRGGQKGCMIKRSKRSPIVPLTWRLESASDHKWCTRQEGLSVLPQRPEQHLDIVQRDEEM